MTGTYPLAMPNKSVIITIKHGADTYHLTYGDKLTDEELFTKAEHLGKTQWEWRKGDTISFRKKTWTYDGFRWRKTETDEELQAQPENYLDK